MSYRVKYNRSESEYKGKGNVPGAWLCLLTLALVVVVVFYCSNDLLRNMIQDLFIPGDVAVTKAAFANMIGQLQNGNSVTDSLMAFCIQILEGAGFAANR